MKRLDATAQNGCKISLETETPTTLGLPREETGHAIAVELAFKWEERIERYQSKRGKAKGTDMVNQGAKIKATIECRQDLIRRFGIKDLLQSYEGFSNSSPDSKIL